MGWDARASRERDDDENGKMGQSNHARGGGGYDVRARGATLGRAECETATGDARRRRRGAGNERGAKRG